MATYTLSKSSFRHAFESDNPEWGEVDVGDELPYLPVHQLAVQAGARWRGVEIDLAGRYTSSMRDVAGQGTIPEGVGTDSQLILDVAASLDAGKYGKAYLTVDNVLDQASIVARRPYGARPGVPRLVIVGYKKSF
jgi:Fe(3+) dicitrate transport protein